MASPLFDRKLVLANVVFKIEKKLQKNPNTAVVAVYNLALQAP